MHVHFLDLVLILGDLLAQLVLHVIELNDLFLLLVDNSGIFRDLLGLLVYLRIYVVQLLPHVIVLVPLEERLAQDLIEVVLKLVAILTSGLNSLLDLFVNSCRHLKEALFILELGLLFVGGSQVLEEGLFKGLA